MTEENKMPDVVWVVRGPDLNDYDYVCAKDKKQLFNSVPYISPTHPVLEGMAEALRGMIEYYEPGIPREPDHIINQAKNSLAAFENMKKGK